MRFAGAGSMTYTATCSHCGELMLTAETIRPEDLEPLSAHLRTKHARLVIGVRTWRLKEVLRHYRVTTTSS